MVRQFARTIDKALSTSTTALGPNGLESIAYQEIDVGGPFVDFDSFGEAISLVKRVGSVVTSLFRILQHRADTRPFEALAAQRRTSCVTSRYCRIRPGDVANPVQRSIFGVPPYSARGHRRRRSGVGHRSRQDVHRYAARYLSDR